MEKKKRNPIGGRPLKKNPSKSRFTVNMNEQERILFEAMVEESGRSISKFILAAIFQREIKVVKIDKATCDYYIRLTNFYHQFQMIGNNYNQTVTAIKANFGEKRAVILLYKLFAITTELVVLNKRIIELTMEFEQKYLKK